MLLSPQDQKNRIHLRKHHLSSFNNRMTLWTKRDHQMKFGDAGFAMMNRDRALCATGSATTPTGVVVSLQHFLTQAAEVSSILPLQRVARRTQPMRENIRSPARAVHGDL